MSRAHCEAARGGGGAAGPGPGVPPPLPAAAHRRPAALLPGPAQRVRPPRTGRPSSCGPRCCSGRRRPASSPSRRPGRRGPPGRSPARCSPRSPPPSPPSRRSSGSRSWRRSTATPPATSRRRRSTGRTSTRRRSRQREIDRVEDVFRSERGQWGQLVVKSAAPAPPAARGEGAPARGDGGMLTACRRGIRDARQLGLDLVQPLRRRAGAFAGLAQPHQRVQRAACLPGQPGGRRWRG